MLSMNIYILSTGRTGTKFLAELFRVSSSEKLTATHEKKGSRILNIAGNLYVSRLINSKVLSFIWSLSGYSHTENSVDSNNFLWAALEHNKNLTKEDLVIHVIRDPRDYVASHLSIAEHRWKSFIANKILPFWHPNPWLTGRISLIEYMKLNLFQRMCYSWEIKNLHIQRTYMNKCRFIQIRYEDVFSNNLDIREKSIASIEKASRTPFRMNRSLFEKKINQEKRRSIENWEHWPKEMARSLQKTCGNLAKEYGYCSEPKWLKLSSEQ